MSVESCRKIGQRSAGVFDNEGRNASIVSLTFRNDHGCAFFDGLIDELMSIGFFATQCHKQAVPLHSPRVIRDAFHRAIKCPDDLANWNRGDESFELHEVSTCRGKAFNGAEHWLRRLVPLAQPCELAPPAWVFRPVLVGSLCEFPHAAQDRDTGQPFRLPWKRSVPQ